MWGFLFSLLLTVGAYIPVEIHFSSHHSVFSHELLVPLVLILAIVQLFIQTIFFLHLAFESRPRFRLTFLISTIGVVVMVVIGSLWIMENLNNNMNPSTVENHIIRDEGIYQH
jgi:cytochrome o ubiquinol oxidase operon protein cyoD